MADLSAASDPGSGHLLGHVLRDGKAVSMAAYHVGISSVYVEVFAFHLVYEAFFFPHCGPSMFSLAADRQGTSQPPWLHIGHSINSTNDSITSSNSPDNDSALSSVTCLLLPHTVACTHSI